MAWTLFPVPEGRAFSRPVFQELLDACTERGIGLASDGYTVPVEGSSVDTVYCWLESVRRYIVSAATGAFHLVQSYSGPRDHAIYHLVTGDDAASTDVGDPLIKGDRNLWRAAVGTQASTWMHSLTAGLHISIDALNEMQQVLDVLKWRTLGASLWYLHPSWADDRISGATLYDQNLAAACAACDALTPSPGADYYGSPWGGGHIGSSCYSSINSDIANPDDPNQETWDRKDSACSNGVAKCQDITPQSGITGTQFTDVLSAYIMNGYRRENGSLPFVWGECRPLGRDAEFSLRHSSAATYPAYPAVIPRSWGEGVTVTHSRGPYVIGWGDGTTDGVVLKLAATTPRTLVRTVLMEGPTSLASAGMDLFPEYPYETIRKYDGTYQYNHGYRRCAEHLWTTHWDSIGLLSLAHLTATG